MGRKSKLWEYFDEQLKDPEFKKLVNEEEKKMRLAFEIIKLREQNSITQATLAEMLGTKQSSIARWENSGFTKINLETLYKIVRLLGADLEINLKLKKVH